MQINCVASGCTDALCNIHVESPSDYATDASSDSFEKYDLKVEFSIPVCHQNMIMYTVYNMTDNRQVVIQDGMIGSVQGSNYHPIPGQFQVNLTLKLASFKAQFGQCVLPVISFFSVYLLLHISFHRSANNKTIYC